MASVDEKVPVEAAPATVEEVTPPAETKEVKAPAVKTFNCSMCSDSLPKSAYSSKQFKAKGKRKCKGCVDLNSAIGGTKAMNLNKEMGKFHVAFLEKDTKGKKTVKTVLANAVEKAQCKTVKEDPNSPEADKYNVLINWLRTGGSKFPHLILKYYTIDYRGVHARRRLNEGECILEVPLPLIMTSDVAKASEIGLKIKESGCQLRSSHSWLAALLLQEKYKPDSFWKPYINILPVHYRNMPIFFDDDELKWLKGSFTLKMISDRKISLKLEYDNICKYVPDFKQYHYLDFFWARLAVITRIFGFKVDGRKTDGLVAMADMLNHKRPNETSWTFDESKRAFTITTTKRLLKGAQIFDSYGRKCNSRYFVNYGFSLDFNEDNQVAMFFSLPKEDTCYQIKVKMLNAHTRRYQLPFEHKEKITRKCFSYLRIAYANLDELLPLANAANIEKIDPINARNEAQCVYAVAREAKRVYSGFDTTLAEDNEMLKNPDSKLTMNQRNCVIMRRGEKEVLEAYIDLAERVKIIENMDLRDVKKYMQRNVNNRGHSPTMPWRLENWFNDIWIPLLTGEKKEIEEMNNSLGV